MFRNALIAAILFLYGQPLVAQTLNVGVPNRIHSLDPRRTSFAQERFILSLIYEPLFQFDGEQNIKPTLAESYSEIRPGIIRVKLRANKFFHNSKPITPLDVKKSVVELCKNAARGVQAIRSVVGCGASSAEPLIEIHSASELDFQIRTSANFFLYELASSFVSVFKVENGVAIGSGPFKVLDIVDGNATLQRIDSISPTKIRFLYVKDNSLVDDLKRGTIDVGSMYRESDLGGASLTHFNVTRTSSYVTQILVLNPKWLKSLGEAAVNGLKTKLRKLQLSHCGPGRSEATGVVPSGIGGHLEGLSARPKLNGQAKTKSKTTLVLYQAADRANDCENKAIQLAFAEIGVKVSFNLETNYQDLVAHFGAKEVDGYIELFTFTRDAGRFFERFTPGTSQPFFYIQSPQIQKMLDSATSKNTIGDRFSMYRAISKKIEDFSTVIPFYYQGHLNVANECLKAASLENSNGLNLNTFLFLKDLNPAACKR